VKLAFVIHRLSFYRHLGPVIDRALEAGWRVECWHDYSFSTTELKKYLFPATSAAPRFHYGQPDVQSYSGPAELVQRLARGDADAVVSISTFDLSTAGGGVQDHHPLWACVQSGPDTFHLKSESLESCDLLALYSPWWLDWGIARYQDLECPTDVAALRARLGARSRHVGYCVSEAARLVDRETVRRRWGIPRDQPVVVVLPFPQGVGRNTFWPKHVFAEPSRSRRLFNVLAHRQFQHLSGAWQQVNDVDVVRAARKFCDRNHAFLLVKSREKTPIPAYVKAVADKCLYDESYYPSTIVEALSIADLCISYYSLGVLEASALGVPNLCIATRADDYFGARASRADSIAFESFFNRKDGGVFEFGSVSRTVDPAEAVDALSQRTLDDFRMNATDRQNYSQKFLGSDDGQGAARTLEAIERAAASTDLRQRRVEAAR
jgi:hypothetical protein